MLAGIPFIHAGQHLFWLEHGDFRSFRQDIEFRIGNNGGNFNNLVILRIQAGHFQIDPDQVVL